ncbi:MAG TPA: helix-turn-helix transcriptional regulator [Candidatus Blautia excrementipullorum]|nr:helix-turn-helix transcriptional regulator [Candidatus Blautia excrementipullorum]
MMHINEKDLAEFAGVSVDRIREIEAEGEANLAELRDIAAVLHTSVASVLEKNIFPLQIEFWGHVGIRPMSSDMFIWYPITGDTRELIHQMIGEKFLIVPCMNNRLLMINMENIAEIVLLDDACDKPRFGNWDNEVDCGEAPLEIL